MLKAIRRLITAGSLLVLTGIMAALAAFLPQFWFSFYTDFSRSALTAIGSVTALLPFSLWEILLGLLLVGLIVYLVLCILKRRILLWGATLLETVAVLVFLFVGLWGLNHFGPDLSQRLDMEVHKYTKAELKDAAMYYASMASSYANAVERDSEGNFVLPGFDTLSRQAVEGFDAMEDPLFQSHAPRVKKLLTSHLFSYTGTTGIFVDITAEACVNTETYSADLPYTMCHELSHSAGVAAEDEANYCAYLVCEGHSRPEFRYSGYYNAFLYCFNALYAVSPTDAAAVWNTASAQLQEDVRQARTHYAQYEGSVQDAAQKVNDTYLKAFSQEAGIQSYGLVTDYLIAHYQEITDAG